MLRQLYIIFKDILNVLSRTHITLLFRMIRVRKLKREVQREEREKEDEKMNEFTTREVCTDCKIYFYVFFLN